MRNGISCYQAPSAEVERWIRCIAGKTLHRDKNSASVGPGGRRQASIAGLRIWRGRQGEDGHEQQKSGEVFHQAPPG
jgi:hypothetical protein